MWKRDCMARRVSSSLRVMGSCFSFENADIWIRLGLPSTLLRWTFSSETHRFENALESVSKRDRISIVSVWMVENASKWRRLPKTPARVFSMRMKFNLRHTCSSIVFERFSVDSRKRVKTVEWTRIDECFLDDNENAFFWNAFSIHRVRHIS